MPLNRRQLLSLVAAGAISLAGCSGGEEGTETSPQSDMDDGSGTTETRERTIEMSDSTFDPLRARVASNTTIPWVNQDSYPHTVTSTQFHDAATAWEFEERAEAGEEITHTFEQSGVYEYVCTIHGQGTMCGVVLVGGATLDESLPCEGDGGNGIQY